MANDEQLSKLVHSVDEWNAWRASPVSIDLSKADLSGAELRGADLSEARLRRTNLSGADLRGADLRDADLRRADLRDADLRGADLYRALLYRADLSGAQMMGSDLRRTNLSWARLHATKLDQAKLNGARLRETVFINVNLTNVIGLESCQHHGPSTIDHRTLEQSQNLPINFLRGCGLPDLTIDNLLALNGEAGDFYSCFISYNQIDKAFAQRLHAQLQDRGIRCWLDEHQVLPGDDLYEAVDRGIKLWDKVLLCCSEAALTSWWVDNEIDSAFAKEQKLMKQRKEKVLSLIPLNLDNYLLSDKWKNGKAQQVRSRLAADFTGWDKDDAKFDEQFERLVKALCANEKGRELPPTSKL